VLLLTSLSMKLLLLTSINVALGYVIFMVLDRGLLISGTRNRDGAVERATRAA
jgi:hypothetical protein